MNYKYQLPDKWIAKVCGLEEFANGGTQVSIRTADGKVYRQILISNSKYIVAMRDFGDLPFKIDQIEDIFQDGEDKNPNERGAWAYWDDWRQ
jgi:hypothetical protein